MIEFLFSYAGLFLISLFTVSCYFLAINVYHYLYDSPPKKRSSQTLSSSPVKQILLNSNRDETHSPSRCNTSPLILKEFVDIEDEEYNSSLELYLNPYLLMGFYELILHEKFNVHDKNFLSIMHYHMQQNYFHDIFRIQNNEAPLFDEKLQHILQQMENSPHQKEFLVKDIYHLFKSPQHKSLDYEMDTPQPRSLFS